MAEFDPSAKRERVIQWDEEAIAEHDKERGTRYLFSFYLYKWRVKVQF